VHRPAETSARWCLRTAISVQLNIRRPARTIREEGPRNPATCSAATITKHVEWMCASRWCFSVCVSVGFSVGLSVQKKHTETRFCAQTHFLCFLWHRTAQTRKQRAQTREGAWMWGTSIYYLFDMLNHNSGRGQLRTGVLQNSVAPAAEHTAKRGDPGPLHVHMYIPMSAGRPCSGPGAAVLAFAEVSGSGIRQPHRIKSDIGFTRL
jgi:hypothetical protein